MDNIYVARPGSQMPGGQGAGNPNMTGSYTTNPNMTQVSGSHTPAASQYNGYNRPVRIDRPKTEKISKYGLYTLIYAIVTAFFLYKNHRGVTFPFFAVGTVAYFDFCLRKMEGKWQKKDMIYPIAILLLGISVFLTEDKQMTGLAKWTIGILIGIYSLHILYDETEWKFMRYIQALLQVIGGSIEHFGSAFSETFIFFKERRKDKPVTEAVSAETPAAIADEPVSEPVVRRKKESKLIYVGIGILASIPLVILIVSLLYKADAVFAEAVDRVLELIDLENIIGVLLTVILTFVGAYANIRYLDEKSIRIQDKEHHVYEPVLAITVTSIITAIYLFFCGIQVVYLTFGNYLALPDGYTYAEYAHEGFYELLTVCILNLVIVLVASYFFGESGALKVILTIICACTYIMLVSSAYRMYLYVREYDLTRLRVYVLYGLFVLAILLVGVIIYIYRESFPLFRYGIAILTGAIIILVYSHPTALIARYNIYQMTDRHSTVDIRHLTKLGTDAIPAIMENFDELYEYELAHSKKGPDERRYHYEEEGGYYDDYYYWDDMYRFYQDNFGKNADKDDYDCPLYDMSFRSFNLSKYMAQRANKASHHEYDEDSDYWEDMLDNYLENGKYGGESV